MSDDLKDWLGTDPAAIAPAPVPPTSEAVKALFAEQRHDAEQGKTRDTEGEHAVQPGPPGWRSLGEVAAEVVKGVEARMEPEHEIER